MITELECLQPGGAVLFQATLQLQGLQAESPAALLRTDRDAIGN